MTTEERLRSLLEAEVLPPLRLPLSVDLGVLWMNDGDEPDLNDVAEAVNALPKLLAVVAVVRVWRDYWRGEAGTLKDERHDAALGLQFRQFDAVLRALDEP